MPDAYEYIQWEKDAYPNSYKSLHFIAHSMGNVVVSEALAHAGNEKIADSYAASQAAEVAGAYDAKVDEIIHYNALDPREQEEPFVGPEAAWRYYNSDDGRPFDMPPDRFRFTIPLLHGATTDDAMADMKNNIPADYKGYLYGRINKGNIRITNFFNAFDAALKGWEFGQLTKPDFAYMPWGYVNDCYEDFSNLDCQGRDHFMRGISFIYWPNEDGTLSNPITEDEAHILGSITPGRTHALGQRKVDGGLISGRNISLDLFFTSNQDHSAQFYNTYSKDGVKKYWREVLGTSMQRTLNDGELSGLRTYEQ